MSRIQYMTVNSIIHNVQHCLESNVKYTARYICYIPSHQTDILLTFALMHKLNHITTLEVQLEGTKSGGELQGDFKGKKTSDPSKQKGQHNDILVLVDVIIHVREQTITASEQKKFVLYVISMHCNVNYQTTSIKALSKSARTLICIEFNFCPLSCRKF